MRSLEDELLVPNFRDRKVQTDVKPGLGRKFRLEIASV